LPALANDDLNARRRSQLLRNISQNRIRTNLKLALSLENNLLDVFFCDECPCAEGIEILPLSGSSLQNAVTDALTNDDVKTLRHALIMDDFTPIVNEASAKIIVDSETGEIKGLGVTIPYQGDGLYSAIYYFNCYLEDMEVAAAATSYEHDDQVSMDVYKINEDGEVTITSLHGQSCTYNCVLACCVAAGMSPIAAAGCITACITCAVSGWPACFLCGFCGGIVLGCAIGCCT